MSTLSHHRLTRRGFLGGVAASAAAAILAACGGSKATDTPKPATGATAAPAGTTAPGSGRGDCCPGRAAPLLYRNEAGW